jgi:subtilisin family serine protease
MASPHVAGVAAQFKQGNPTASTATVDAWIKNGATPNVISGNPTGTPNRLLYNGTL